MRTKAEKNKQEPENWIVFRECMSQMADVPAFRFALSDGVLDTYWMFLRQYSGSELRQAFLRAIGDAEKVCPTPAQIKNHARAIHIEEHAPEQPVRELTAEEKADLARWNEELRNRAIRGETGKPSWEASS